MGYSITVPFKSAEEKEKMKKFLLENKEILDKLKSNTVDDTPHDNTPQEGKDLSYAPDKENLLGFYGTGIPRYIWDLCSWMAVKSEFRDENEKSFIYYDDEKIMVTFDTADSSNIIVDSEGLRIRNSEKTISKKIIESFLGIKKEQENSTKLLNQLNDNWSEYINSLPPLTSKKKFKP